MIETGDPIDEALAASAGPPPGWFTEALAVPAADASVEVAGARISYRTWGRPGLPGVVLVHGTAAHAQWWDHIAPFLAGSPSRDGGLRVVAVSMSGHGDSDWRDRYDLSQWGDEIMAVASAAEIGGPPVIIGHSLGGMVAITTARRYGSALTGIVVIDSPLYEGRPPAKRPVPAMGFGTQRTYPSREAILDRFRLVPEQPVLPYIRDHVAAWSVTARDNGWYWKFDQRLFAKMIPPSLPTPTARPGCLIAIFRAEHGLMSSEIAQTTRLLLGQAATVVELPAAGHHVMLDQPLSLVAALRTVLAGWIAPGPREPAVPDMPADGARSGVERARFPH
jgi:pimeloyl-ACP methyl ester carboxylesterase